jgi:hypothetical protein
MVPDLSRTERPRKMQGHELAPARSTCARERTRARARSPRFNRDPLGTILMSKHAKQHYVPQSYLSAWVDSDTPQGQEPYVWVFPKEETAGRKKAPKNVFWEGDMYPIRFPGGGRDLGLAHGLQTLETEFAKVRRTTLSGQPLTDEDYAIICLFAAALYARTTSQRDHIADQWGNVLEKMKEMDRALDTLTRSLKRL